MIERTEERFVSRDTDTGAANDWLPRRTHWEARISSEHLLTRSSEEAAENSCNRRLALAAWPGRFERGGFDWVVPPVLNPFTRIAIEMCPAKGLLRAVGYEKSPAAELAEPVTARREYQESGNQESGIRCQ